MTASTEPLASGKDRLDKTRLDRLGVVLALFAFLLPLLGLLAPKAVVPLAFATTACCVLIAGAHALPWRIMDRPIVLALGLLITWCLIASIWAAFPGDAATLALRVGTLLVIMVYLCAVASLLEQPQRRTAALGFAAGMGLTAILVVIEFAFGFPIFSALKGEAASEYHAYSRLNRGISALAVLAWPLAAFFWHSGRRGLTLAVPPAILALTLASQSSAAVLGLTLGLLAAGLASLGRRAGRLVLIIAVAGALVASPGIAKLMKQAAFHQADYLPETARYRVYIWDFVAERILERPLAGWGFDSSAFVPTGDAKPFRSGDKLIPSHPHNGSLQILLELGAIGAALTTILLFLLGRRIDGLPAASRICAQGMFITLICIASSAYGLWQSHWLTMIGSAAVIMILASPKPKRTESQPPPPEESGS